MNQVTISSSSRVNANNGASSAIRFALMPAIAVVFSLTLCRATQATVLTVFSDQFNAGNVNGWVDNDSSPGSVEIWAGAGGASARGLSTVYDPTIPYGGAQTVTIPGGIEVMDASGAPTTNRFVEVNFTLPLNVYVGDNATLSFFIANRIASGLGGNDPRVELINTTDTRTLLALTGITPFSPYGNGGWNNKTFSIPLVGADLGDNMRLRFYETISGANSGARGLEVADVSFLATPTPEPATVTLLGIAGLLMLLLRYGRRNV